MSSASKKSKRNSTQSDRPPHPAKTSRRLPQATQDDVSESMRHLAERMEKRSPRIKVVMDVPGEEKMSAVLGHFIKPYAHLAETGEAYERLVALAAIAWNAALLNPEQREEFLGKAERNLPESARPEFYDLVADLMERKKRYFANNRRMILDCRITETPYTFHLAVISTLTPEGKQEAADLLARIPAIKRKKPSILARILAFFRR